MSNTYAAPLDPVSIDFQIKLDSEKFGNATLGNFEINLSRTDSGYSSHSITKAQGMAAIIIGSNEEQFCDFDVVDGRAVSRNYRGGRIGVTDYQVAYDWEGRKVDFSNQETHDMPQGYIVDNCTMWFAAAFSKGEGLESEAMYVVDGKKKRIRGFTLQSTSQEQIETKIGTKQVVKMVLQREFKPERTLTFWLSPEDQYLPLRMQETRKSRTTTFEVERLER